MKLSPLACMKLQGKRKKFNEGGLSESDWKDLIYDGGPTDTEITPRYTDEVWTPTEDADLGGDEEGDGSVEYRRGEPYPIDFLQVLVNEASQNGTTLKAQLENLRDSGALSAETLRQLGGGLQPQAAPSFGIDARDYDSQNTTFSPYNSSQKPAEINLEKLLAALAPKKAEPFSLTDSKGDLNWGNLLKLGLTGFGGLTAYKGAQDRNAALKQYYDQQAQQQALVNQASKRFNIPGGYAAAALTPATTKFKPLA